MYCNIAAYKFVALSEEELPTICTNLKKMGMQFSLKGTILLGTEGINLFLAGEKEFINSFQGKLATSYTFFEDLPYKYSYSNFVPFKKLVVKIRKEIVTFKQEEIKPEKFTAPYISAQELRNWLQTKQEVILLDTRNEFEYKMGTFSSAIHLNIKNFREFPEALTENKIDKGKPIVTFCTGGIRCEKAATYLLEQGYGDVYQLQGGILSYFEHCGNDFYQGDCFVFDDRIALNSKLEPISLEINQDLD